MRIITILFALPLLSVAAESAQARDDAAASRAVSVAGLDLAQQHGQTVAQRLIETAALTVCGGSLDSVRFVPAPVARCRAEAAAHAQQQLALRSETERRDVAMAAKR